MSNVKNKLSQTAIHFKGNKSVYVPKPLKNAWDLLFGGKDSEKIENIFKQFLDDDYDIFIIPKTRHDKNPRDDVQIPIPFVERLYG